MGKTQGLTIADVRAVFHLLDDLRDLGLQPAVWKRHMLSSLCQLIGGQVGITVQTHDAGMIDLGSSVVTDIGWAGERERRAWIEYCRRNDLSVDPSRGEIMRLMTIGRPFVRVREQLCHDRAWYASDHVQSTRRESDVDSFIFSYRRMLNPQRHHWIYLLRPWDDRAFQPRQRRLVRLFHDELGRIIDEDALRSAQRIPAARLSPRLHQTLDLLAAGLAEKQVAVTLGCSRNTIHGYVKELHRRFAVNTRSELLVSLYQTRASVRPRLVL
jgi:DNA-binding CsgD family transcriptional regulator